MPGVRRALPTIAALALVMGVAGCGSNNSDSSKIPSNLANELLQPLDNAQSNAEAGQCTAVQSNAKDFAQEVAGIGANDIDPAIKKKLVEASASLKDLAVSDCEQTATGPSGAQGSTNTGDSSVADNTTTTSTPEVPASDESVPAATGEPANAKPTTPAAPATEAKPSKEAKPPKPVKGPKPNGPPGPVGNPNHSAANSDSGGVSPRSGG